MVIFRWESWQFLGNSSEIYAHTFYKIFVSDVLPPPCENKGWEEKEGLRMMICRAFRIQGEVEILLKGWHYSFPRGGGGGVERNYRERRTCEKYCCFPWKFRRNKGRTWKLIWPFSSQLFPLTLRASLINCQLKKEVFI